MIVPDKYIKFSKEFDGEIVAYDNNMCTAMRIRDLEVTIQNRLSKSPLVLSAMVSYEYDLENEDQDALCLLQIPVTENEIDLIVPILRSLDIKIDGLNGRFLKTDPPMYYVTGHIIDDPTIFAINISHIFNILKL